MGATMILLTDSYGNPCCVQEEWIQMAFVAKGDTDTTVLMSSGDAIAVREGPEDIFEYSEGLILMEAEVDNCETCAYELNAPEDEPCNSCSIRDAERPDSQWEPAPEKDEAEAEEPPRLVQVSGVPYPVQITNKGPGGVHD